jgi:cardiolipin synthase
MNSSTAKIVTIALVAGLLGGCAASDPLSQPDENPAARIAGPDNLVERRSSAVAQGGVLIARSLPGDPINRPISNVMSLSSYAISSVAGLLHRVAIGTTRFPALEMQPIPEIGNGKTMDLAAFEAFLERMTGREASSGTIEFLVDGEAYFTRLESALQEAGESIDIRTYIFDNDDYAVRVADILKARSADIDVRVMVDGLGNLMATQTDPESMSSTFAAPPSIEQYLEDGSGVRVRTLTNPWLTGDHTKTTIIDRRIAFIGGMNIGREYRYDWHDLMMEVHGPIVDQLQSDSDRAWAKAGMFGDIAQLFSFLGARKSRAEPSGYPIRALYTREFDAQIYRAQLEAIRRARAYIMIENSYFSDDATLYELARARRRGVDVRVILPEDGNHGSHDASNAVAINKMLRNGIRVYRYPGMSHIKAAVIDGWASVGTANFDKLSLQVNKEVNLATSYGPAVDELLSRVFIPDLAASTEITRMVDISLQARLLEVVVDEVL